MVSNLLRPLRRGSLVALAFATVVSGAEAQAGCPDSATARLARSWTSYRADSLDAAEAGFRALARCHSLGGLTGLGFVALRRGQLAAADSLFSAVLARDSAQVDAWEGLARSAWRRGDPIATAHATRAALRLAPNRPDLQALLVQAAPDGERPPLPPRRRPETLALPARTAGERFEIRDAAGQWRPFYIQGVNLGVALPGHFPSEFPTDSSRYAGWLDTLSAMHANALRVYTILPPAFYRALRGWNMAHPDRPLWLIHGVWTELPPKHDFDDPEWKGAFRSEMRNVVDLVHGSTDLPPRPGHASGRYDADVSPWTLAYIIGREWEPYAVAAYRLRACRASAPMPGATWRRVAPRPWTSGWRNSATTCCPTSRTSGTRSGRSRTPTGRPSIP